MINPYKDYGWARLKKVEDKMEKCNNPKAYILSMSGRIVYDARTGVIEDSPNWRVQPLRTKSATRRVMTNQEIAEVDDYFEE